jgi:hypothetical protein
MIFSLGISQIKKDVINTIKTGSPLKTTYILLRLRDSHSKKKINKVISIPFLKTYGWSIQPQKKTLFLSKTSSLTADDLFFFYWRKQEYVR